MSERDLQQSPIERVRSYLLSILTPQQLQVVQQLLDGIDENSGGPPAPVALQEGGTEPGGKPARDTTPGYGPTDAGQGLPTGFDRRRMARDNPPSFPGRPRPGGGRDPFRQEVQMSGFAGDAMFEDRTLRAALRRRGVPIGNEGTLPQLRRACRAYGVPTGMAMDAAPHHASGDVDSVLDTVSRVGSMSYMGHVRAEPPRARTDAMAYDADSGMNSIARHFPAVAANWMKNEARAFTAPVVPGLDRADERFPGRRSRAIDAMAFDTASQASASRGPSIAQVFGSELAAHLGRIGTVSR